MVVSSFASRSLTRFSAAFALPFASAASLSAATFWVKAVRQGGERKVQIRKNEERGKKVSDLSVARSRRGTAHSPRGRGSPPYPRLTFSLAALYFDSI